MVTVQVRYEDMVDEREMYVSPAELQLCALSAINHEKLVAYPDNLRTGVVAGGGECRSAAQYMYFERFHSTANLSIRMIISKCSVLIMGQK